MKPNFNGRYRGMECRVYLVRENPSIKPVEMNNARDVYDLVKQEMISADREMFLSVYISAANSLIGVETVSVATLSACMVSAREVFKGAILAYAVSIIICHNHPSGSLIPSAEDIRLTDLLIKAGDILDIKVLDHLIIGNDGYQSIINH